MPNGSEVVAIDTGKLGEVEKGERHIQKAVKGQRAVGVKVRDMDAPSKSKDVYLYSNFLIGKHEEMNAKSGLDLVFNPKIRVMSSLRQRELALEEVIPEEGVEGRERVENGLE